MEAEQLKLPGAGLFTIHCFFGCPYLAESADAQEAHDLMERHYGEQHVAQIDRIIYRLTGTWPSKTRPESCGSNGRFPA